MKKILSAAAFAASVSLPILALSNASPVQAQTVRQAQVGDYYAPDTTVRQRPSSQDLNEGKSDDYDASGKAVVQQPSRQELNQTPQGDYYAPTKGN